MAIPRDYNKIVKELRKERLISFNYDLRRKLTPGQKSAVSRAYNAYKNIPPTQTIIKLPRRKPRETDYKYKKRLKQIKQTRGQKGSILNALVVQDKDVRQGVKLKYGDDFYITEKLGAGGLKIKIVHIGTPRDYTIKTRQYIKQIVKRFNPTAIQPVYKSGYVGNGRNVGHGELAMFINDMVKHNNKYKGEKYAQIVGFELIDYGDI